MTAYATGFYRTADGVYPEDAVKEARSYVEAGFKGMKLKVGFLPEVDIKYIRAVRKAVGPDIMLMADFNYATTNPLQGELSWSWSRRSCTSLRN